MTKEIRNPKTEWRRARWELGGLVLLCASSLGFGGFLCVLVFGRWHDKAIQGRVTLVPPGETPRLYPDRSGRAAPRRDARRYVLVFGAFVKYSLAAFTQAR